MPTVNYTAPIACNITPTFTQVNPFTCNGTFINGGRVNIGGLTSTSIPTDFIVKVFIDNSEEPTSNYDLTWTGTVWQLDALSLGGTLSSGVHMVTIVVIRVSNNQSYAFNNTTSAC